MTYLIPCLRLFSGTRRSENPEEDYGDCLSDLILFGCEVRRQGIRIIGCNGKMPEKGSVEQVVVVGDFGFASVAFMLCSKLRKPFRKFHTKLVRELEKKFSGKNVIVIATRRIVRPPKKGSAATRRIVIPILLEWNDEFQVCWNHRS
ncbi:unnamed protein product [Lactuca virosa]|uniref:40S ribosomal protein S7 n=1 Tax=Lactuca virosa TaxID=75947 RepID=A0AAU9M9V9_9ASTR|nr:unnamed protein product [Lactuca virosa]